MGQQNDSPLVGLEEMAKLLGVHPKTLRKMKQAGIVRSYKLGPNILRFDPTEVREDMRQHLYDEKRRKKK